MIEKKEKSWYKVSKKDFKISSPYLNQFHLIEKHLHNFDLHNSNLKNKVSNLKMFVESLSKSSKNDSEMIVIQYRKKSSKFKDTWDTLDINMIHDLISMN